MVKQFAEKMLKERLDFLPLKESLILNRAGIRIHSRFSWVLHSEELEDNGFGMTDEEAIAEHHEIYGEDDENYLKIGDAYDEFDEFTLDLCPAYTYIDLLKILDNE